MANLLNVKLQEIHEGKRDYLRYKGRDGRYHFLDTKEMPDSDTNSVTYGQLVEMRQAALLEPGMLYRITDYATTTVQENTRSAGHQFDIVVMALDSKTLAERAWAMPHDGDEYFKNSKLEAWQLWYCLDNDVARFMWADGGGFKIEDNDTAFRRNPSSDTGDFYGWTDGETLLFTNTLYPAVGTQTYDDQFSPADKVKEVVAGGKGVIYRMIDEFFNDCPYDFKNIQFKRWAVSGLTNAKLDQDTLDGLASDFVYDADDNPFCFAVESSNMTRGSTTFVVNNEVSEWYYTFSLYDEEGHLNDYSLHVYKVYCEGNMAVAQSNSMLPAQDCDPNDEDEVYRYVLNNNVFLDKYDGENEWYTFCIGNEFKERSKNNTFGANAGNNSFGANAYGNNFGAYADSNSFGANAQNNAFGANAGYNNFGAGANNNSFGAYAWNNTFGAGFYGNSFGAGADGNSFGANARYNNFGAYARFNNFGAGAARNSFGAGANNNSFGAYVTSCVFAKDYTRYVVVESGNNNITLTSSQTTSQSSQLQNILIALGTNLSGSKTISHNTVGDTFKTTYQNANSDVVDV